MAQAVLLGLIGSAEAVVYWFRYRCGDGHAAWWVALWTFMVCALRVAFVALGVSAAMSGMHWAVAVAAYAVPAAVVTGLVQAVGTPTGWHLAIDKKLKKRLVKERKNGAGAGAPPQIVCREEPTEGTGHQARGTRVGEDQVQNQCPVPSP